MFRSGIILFSSSSYCTFLLYTKLLHYASYTLTIYPPVLNTAYNETASSCDVVESIAQFFNSHWFRRLWVALEYISRTRACLMVESNKIISLEHSLDSFTPIIDFFKDINSYLSIKEGSDFFNAEATLHYLVTQGFLNRAGVSKHFSSRAFCSMRVLSAIVACNDSDISSIFPSTISDI